MLQLPRQRSPNLSLPLLLPGSQVSSSHGLHCPSLLLLSGCVTEPSTSACCSSLGARLFARALSSSDYLGAMGRGLRSCSCLSQLTFTIPGVNHNGQLSYKKRSWHLICRETSDFPKHMSRFELEQDTFSSEILLLQLQGSSPSHGGCILSRGVGTLGRAQGCGKPPSCDLVGPCQPCAPATLPKKLSRAPCVQAAAR